MGKHRTILNHSELLEFSKEHLCHEIGMLLQAARTLGYSFTQSGPDIGVQNVTMECFALHVLNLVDFFYPVQPDGKKDDVLARDFFATGTLPPAFPLISDLLKNARARAHKEISHITSKRYYGKHPDKVWNWYEIIGALLVPLRAFRTQSAPSKLHRNVAEAIASVEKAFGQAQGA
jgi:hypothetical protein